MNIDLRNKVKIVSENFLFKLMNNAVFGRTKEKVRRNNDIKTVTIERRRNCFVPETNNHTSKFFTERLWAIVMKKRWYL